MITASCEQRSLVVEVSLWLSFRTSYVMRSLVIGFIDSDTCLSPSMSPDSSCRICEIRGHLGKTAEQSEKDLAPRHVTSDVGACFCLLKAFTGLGIQRFRASLITGIVKCDRIATDEAYYNQESNGLYTNTMSSAVVSPEPDYEDDRVCWVCLDSGLDGNANECWSRPCGCRGALKWVHQSCLQRWIDEQQSGTGQSTPVSCRACGVEYELVYPPASLAYLILESVDSKTRVLSCYFAGGLVVGSVYWSAVTYGAITVMQVLGHHQGLQVMENMNPLALLVCLPTIPICLILAKAIPWEKFLQKLWRQYISRLGLVRRLTETPTWPVRERAVEPAPDGYELPRLFCSALVLPTIATMTGRLLFRRTRSDTYRTVLGGLTYLGIKGILSVSYREIRYMRACHRIVKNYEGN